MEKPNSILSPYFSVDTPQPSFSPFCSLIMLIFIGPCLNLQWTALHALRSSLGEMRFSELINNGGKEIKRRKKKSINDRKPVFKLYIMYYSATCNLSSDRCHCSIWHMYKRRKCRMRKRLSYHFWRGCYYFITVSTAVPPTVWLWKDSSSPPHENMVWSHSCSNWFLTGIQQSRTHTPAWVTVPFIPSTQNTKHVSNFK